MQAVLEVLDAVGRGRLPRDSGIAVIVATGVPAEVAERIVGKLGAGFKVTEPIVRPQG